MAKDVIIASNNAHKVEEIRNALTFEGWNFMTLAEAGIESDPEETGTTFWRNAHIKAEAAHKLSGKAVLADDSGLVVDALHGEPGVYSSRYAGENATDEENNAKLLKELEGVGNMYRGARFVCEMCFIDEDGSEVNSRGEVHGMITFEPLGDNGFGYDPLFIPEDFEQRLTLAQVPQEKKNSVSHRGNALRQLREKLKTKGYSLL